MPWLCFVFFSVEFGSEVCCELVHASKRYLEKSVTNLEDCPLSGIYQINDKGETREMDSMIWL